MKAKTDSITRITIITTFLILLTLAAFTTDSAAQLWDPSRPDSNAPAGVMNDHVHKAGHWMLSYKYMYMSMDGMRDGTRGVSTREVLEDYMMAPTKMDMQMHMFGIMYAPTDSINVMAMIPYVRKSMSHVTRMGDHFKVDTEGLGDISFTTIFKVFDAHRQRIQLNAGVSFPTGSVSEKGNTPMGNNVPLAYPMQLGSGTLDLIPGITYLGQYGRFSWGSQASAVLRIAENSKDYALGDRFDATAWGAWDWFDWISTSARADWQSWGNIDGANPALNPDMMPTNDPNLQGGNMLDLLFGLNFYVPKGPTLIKGQRISAEFGFPVYQDLDGPQMETDWVLWIGWQYGWSFDKKHHDHSGHN